MLNVDNALRAWIVENAARGCTLESMVDSMVTAGHARDYARAVLAQVLAERAAGVSAPAGTGTRADTGDPAIRRDIAALERARAAGPRVSVPEPLPAGAPAFVATSDRRISVLAALKTPRVIVFGNVFSADECEQLIELSRSKLERSQVVDRTTGTGAENPERSSEGTFFYVNENPFIATLDRRIGELLRWPVENGEGLQILHYKKGGEYRPHYDYFDPGDPGSAPHIAKGGNRVGTLIVYLAGSEEGGSTAFPDIGLDVAPIQGNAVFFSYDIAAPASLTLHAGTPVVRGEKWIATKWVRQGPYR